MAAPTGIVTVKWRLPSTQDARNASELAIRKAAIKAVSIILRRTAKGIDARGAPFRPYSKPYAKLKASTGRNATPPDLTLTGTLLRGLRLLRVESPRRAIIGWEGQHSTRRIFNRSFGITRLRQLTQGRASGLAQGPITQEEAKFLAAANLQRNKERKARGETAGRVTMPYSVLVPALNKRRRFFSIESAADVAAIRAVYADELRKQMRLRITGR